MAIQDDDSKAGASKADKMNSGLNTEKKKWPTPEEADQEDQEVGGEMGDLKSKSQEQASTESEAAPSLDQAAVQQLQEQLIAAQREIMEFKNEHLRAQAEMENTRRRAALDVEKARKFALEKFAAELLPVADCLGHALECEFGDNQFAKSIHEGVEMTMNMFLQTLDRFGIKQIDPMGETFDHNTHQAVSIEENSQAKSNTVVKVLQKGYVLNDRLIRPAMVIVAK